MLLSETHSIDMPRRAVEVEQCFNTSNAALCTRISSLGYRKTHRNSKIWGMSGMIYGALMKSHLHSICICPISDLHPFMLQRTEFKTLDPSIDIVVQLPRFSDERVQRFDQGLQHCVVEHDICERESVSRTSISMTRVAELARRETRQVTREKR